MRMNMRRLWYALMGAAALALPAGSAMAATTIGNNVSVGGALTVTGNAALSGTLSVTGLSTLTAGFNSSASSSIASSLNVSGNLNVSSTQFAGGHILPGANNSYDLGAQGNGFRSVYVSSSLTIGGNGSTASATPITAHLSAITAAIDLADAASSTAKCTSSSVSLSGAAMGDTLLVSPLTYDDAFVAGQLTAVPTGANTVAIMYCAPNAAADRDPGSILYRIDVWKH